VGENDFLVGIHTNSRQDRGIRCWEEAKFAEVANHLIERHGAKIIFTDIPADQKYVEPITRMIGRKERIVAPFETTIPELYALLRRIDLLITINTAPLHLAVDAGTPLVAILGYAPAYLYFPPGDGRFQWVEDPALKHFNPRLIRQTEPSRVREIPVRDVLEKVEYLIRHVIPRTAGKAAGGG
jgi:ADP-heptose:LPS heptosyltransferase